MQEGQFKVILSHIASLLQKTPLKRLAPIRQQKHKWEINRESRAISSVSKELRSSGQSGKG